MFSSQVYLVTFIILSHFEKSRPEKNVGLNKASLYQS